MNKFFFALLSTCIFFNVSAFAQAEEDKTLSPYFMVNSDDPSLDMLPLKATRADVNIAGVIADVTVTQVYRNEGSRPLEAIYVFPGSTRAAVYGMEMTIGLRTIKAEIREREQARQEYEAAKEEGKRASLLEQDRPNVFQMNVANIMPGDEIEVVLKYTELLIPEDGVYSFVYPSVVGPRYTGESTTTASASNDFVASPYLQEGLAQPYEFDVSVRLNAGLPIQEIGSITHDVDLSFPESHSAYVQLTKASKATGGNRDYVLEYRLAGGEIESGLLLYEHEDENFFLLMVQPPKKVEVAQIPPREYVFIVDVSGSMNGFPLDISKMLLRNLLVGLRSTDQFNILLFAGGSEVLAGESLKVNPENIDKGLNFLQNARGGGGTELLSALNRALALPRCTEDIARSFVVITDGYVNVEKEAFDLIRQNLDEANLYSFGIGSGVNRFIIEGMAHVGKSEPLIITSPEEASAKAAKFREYIESPVLTRVKIDYGDFDVYDVEPITIPDVLAQRPVIIYGKYHGKAQGTIKLTGHTGKGKYKAQFAVGAVEAAESNQAVRYLWARERIRLLDDYSQLTYGDELSEEVKQLGLQYNLMTAYTSFIAIDQVPVAAGEDAETVNQPLPLPLGVSDMAIGFDMEIEGISHHTTVVEDSIQTEVVLGLLNADLALLQKASLKAWLINQFSSMKDAALMESAGMILRVTLDAKGQLISWEIVEGILSQDQLFYLEEQLGDWVYSGVLPATGCALEVEIQF